MNDKNEGLWKNNLIQFARLISEVQQIGGFNMTAMDHLCESMDLPQQEVEDLVDRAHDIFELTKRTILPGTTTSDGTLVCCPRCSGLHVTQAGKWTGITTDNFLSVDLHEYECQDCKGASFWV